MVTIRNANELIESLIDFYRVRQPNMDTKEGAVSRDLFVEGPSAQVSLVYDELSKVSDLQSLGQSLGNDLDNLAQNFNIFRRPATKSSGIALLTFSSIPTIIGIPKGSVILSNNNISFVTLTGVSVNPSSINLYRAIATRFSNDLSFLGITDPYAVEVAVSATTPGIVGNISKYGLVSTATSGVTNVTNVFPFTGGANQESDTAFRNRVLSVFSGSNVGTSLGYQNIVKSNTDVIDAIVIEPGDPLMTRDGTQVTQNTDGSFTITSEGQGGKVDVIVLGSTLSAFVDSFIYQDKSNRNDPTDPANIFVLGQIADDVNKTINRKRIDDLSTGILPSQPIQEITQVTGSLSGSFVPKQVDQFGNVTGNYELVKDTGVYSGSAWGFDKFHWISDRISKFPEDKVKGQTNGQDVLAFSDVINVSSVQQNISIANENSVILGTDRSSVFLLHTPCTNVTRVFNLTTGERYTVTSQNPDGTGTVNTTGRVSIAGNTLPSTSDVLQVDYTWIVSYDPYIDYDGRLINNNPRSVQDSIDWGISNAVRRERALAVKNGSGTSFNVTTSLPISSVINANIFTETTSTVSLVTTGIFQGSLSASITGLLEIPSVINGVVEKNTQKELFNTAQNNGTFTATKIISGGNVTYTITVILPSDTVANVGDVVTIEYNASDIYTVSGVSGNFNTNTITIPASNYIMGPSSFTVEINYIANVQNLFTINLTDLPVSRAGNGYTRNNLSPSLYSNPGLTIRKDFEIVSGAGASASIETAISSLECTLTATNVIAVVRLSDGKELWNATNTGTVTIATDNNYVINLTGFNSPVNSDKVLALYFANDIARTEPTTFVNNIVASIPATTVLDSGTGEFSLTGITIPDNISPSNVYVVRLSDGMELTDANVTIDKTNSKIIFSPAKQTILAGGETVYVVFYNTKTLRQSITKVSATLTDQINNSGTLVVSGTTITKVGSAIFTAINSGLTQDLSQAVSNAMGLTAAQSIPSNLKVVRVVSMEKVQTTSGIVTDVLATLDTDLTKVNDTTYFPNETLPDATIGNLVVTLPSTTSNVSNAPIIGDTIRVTFYYSNDSDSENLVFTRNGTVYGNKTFATINSVHTSSGFNASNTGKLTFGTFNQPSSGTRYRAFYDYTAPKQNERIIIQTTYNKLIGDASITLEPQRPINADVLIKAAAPLNINISLAIVVDANYVTSVNVVLQNVKNQITNTINTQKLGGILDGSVLESAAQSVAGVDRVRITYFNVDGRVGNVLSITAQKNQYFVPNDIVVVSEGR